MLTSTAFVLLACVGFIGFSVYRYRLSYLNDLTGLTKKVTVSAIENGINITIDRAFEPLFTTRARGTGLGLAVVKKIIEEHNGSISLSSELGIGTKVSFVIPAVGI